MVTGGAPSTGELELASLHRRALASLISLFTLGAALAGLVAGIVLLAKLGVAGRVRRTRPGRFAATQVRRRVDSRLESLREARSAGRRAPSSRRRVGFGALALTLGVLTRNVRGPGFRVLGLRRVDARTGGPVTVRAALVQGAVQQGRSAVLDRIFSPASRPSCAPIAGRFAIALATAAPLPWSARRQSLVEKLAGTVVVDEHRPA